MNPTQMRFAFEFQKQLLPMVAEELITADAATILVGSAAEMIENYANELAEELHRLAREWEAKMGDEDQTLYSLGVRHAVDLVRGDTREQDS